MPSVSGAQHRQFEVWEHNRSQRPPSLSAKQVAEWTHADRGNPAARGTGHVRHPKHRAAGGGILAFDGGGSVSGADPNTLDQMLAQLYMQSLEPQGWGGGATGGTPPAPANSPAPQNDTSQWSQSGLDYGDHARGGLVRQAGGILPGPVESQSPMLRGYYQQLMQMPPEKLQELQAKMPPNSPYRRLVQTAIQMQHMQPTETQPTPSPAPTPSLQAEQASQQQSQQQGQQPPGILADTEPQQQARGGEVQRFQFGGEPLGMSLSMADPWWSRRASYGMDSTSGYLHGNTAGRADNLTTTAPGGAYVMPADVLAGLGEGNGVFGARVVDEMMHSYIHGARPPRGAGRGVGMPRPPRPASDTSNRAKGGALDDESIEGIGKPVPVKLSHGEMVIEPARVLALGRSILRKEGGRGVSTKIAMKTGHDFLDEVVKEARRRHIEKLKKLPGPTR